MKRKFFIPIKAVVLTACMCVFNYIGYAQFQNLPGSGNDSWRFLPNNVSRIGLGNFPNGTNLPSTLTIDGNTDDFPTGEVFRTDCPLGDATAWRMFRGGTPIGSIFNNFTDDNLFLEANRPNSSMIFNTGGTNERMRITSDGNVVIGSQGKA